MIYALQYCWVFTVGSREHFEPDDILLVLAWLHPNRPRVFTLYDSFIGKEEREREKKKASAYTDTISTLEDKCSVTSLGVFSFLVLQVI